jgi:hypothetical protein
MKQQDVEVKLSAIADNKSVELTPSNFLRPCTAF